MDYITSFKNSTRPPKKQKNKKQKQRLHYRLRNRCHLNQQFWLLDGSQLLDRREENIIIELFDCQFKKKYPFVSYWKTNGIFQENWRWGFIWKVTPEDFIHGLKS